MKRLMKPADFVAHNPLGTTKWRCGHGISSTYPCPDCFSVWIGDDPIDRTSDWKLRYEELEREQP